MKSGERCDSTESEVRRRIATEMQRGFREFQRQNRFVATAGMTDLTLVESQLLVEVDGTPGIDFTVARERLSVDPVKISRTVASLSKRSLLQVGGNAADRRRKRLHLTAEGAKLVAQVDKESNETLARLRERITPAEGERTRSYLTRLADGLSGPQTVHRLCEDPLRPAIRRLTRSMGLLGQNVYGASGLSSLEWLVIARLATSETPLTARALSDFFSVPPNTMSDLIKRFCQDDIIVQERGGDIRDRRSHPLRLGEAGRHLFVKVHSLAVEQTLGAIKTLSDEEALDFCRIWLAFIGLASSPQPSSDQILQPRITIIRFTSVSERTRARSFFLARCAALENFECVGEELFSKKSLCLGLEEENRLLGVAEISLDAETGKGCMRYVSLDDRIVESPIGRSFLEACLRTAANEMGLTRVTLQSHHLPERLIDQLGFERDGWEVWGK